LAFGSADDTAATSRRKTGGAVVAEVAEVAEAAATCMSLSIYRQLA